MAHLEFEKPLVELEDRIRELKVYGVRDTGFEGELRRLEERVEHLQREIYGQLTVWQKVQLSRHPDRPYFLDYVERIFDDVLELHGDRAFADDPAVVAGFARLGGRTVAIIGHQKGRTTKEKVRRNFGMAHPEGYRKAMRIMELANRFRRPVLTFIDTPGAYPGIGAEERGQAEAIARSTDCCLSLTVPMIAVIIGEGGSGGAVAIAAANKVLMLEHSIYSVISPEGAASILWRDSTKAKDAAASMKITAQDLLQLGVIDGIIPEPVGGAHRDRAMAIRRVGEALELALADFDGVTGDEIRGLRQQKFLAIGQAL